MAEESTNPISVSAANTIAKLHAHPFAYLMYYLGGLFILAVSYWYGYVYAIAGVVVVIVSELLRRADTFYILNEGVSRDFALFSTKHIFTSYDQIRAVTVSQGLIARLLGVGDIVMTTVELDEGTIRFSGVRKPYDIAKLIEDRLVTE